MTEFVRSIFFISTKPGYGGLARISASGLKADCSILSCPGYPEKERALGQGIRAFGPKSPVRQDGMLTAVELTYGS